MTLKRQAHKELEAGLVPMLPAIKIQLAENLVRYQQVASYRERTSDRSSDTIQGEVANASGQKKITNTEIPVVNTKHETAMAFMTGTFLSGYPIFSATASRANEAGASMLNRLTGRDQQRMGWLGHLLDCIDDVLLYNICAAEVVWKSKRASGVTSSVAPGVKSTGAHSPVIYDGVSITRIDPYNLFYDRAVKPHEVHEKGNYAGWVESMDLVKLKRLYNDLNPLHTFKENIPKLMKKSDQQETAPGYESLYKTPQIYKYSTKRAPTDLSHLFSSYGTSSTASTKTYEVIHMYRRIVPEDFKVEGASTGTVSVFHLIYVNGLIIYSERLVLGHEYLPIVLGQYRRGDEQKRSFSEYLMDIQDLGTGFMTANLNALRRSVADRMLYDESRIDKSKIDTDNPTAKIPVTNNMFQNTLADSVYVIPFQNNVTPYMNEMMNQAWQLADVATGINPSTQGGFTPGNKTVQEFQGIQSSSQARLQLGAVALSTTFFDPMKEILKILYLVHATSEEIDDSQSDSPVQIDPVVLREQAPSYRMSDGLLPTTKVANTEVLMQALAVMQNMPDMNMEYDIGGIVISVLRQQGWNDIDDYKLTEDQKAQKLQQMQAMIAARGDKSGQPQPTTPQ